VRIGSRSLTGTKKLHADVLASLSGPAYFEWRDSDAGVVVTGSELILHEKDPESVVRIPLAEIRDVTLRRGWWETLLSHFLVVRFEVDGRSQYAQVKTTRRDGEEAVMCIAEASEGNARAHFKIEPIFTPRLLAGLILTGLFVWAAGSVKFYARGQGPFIEVALAAGVMSAVMMLVLGLIAYGQ
jgi:hypothetical protein